MDKLTSVNAHSSTTMAVFTQVLNDPQGRITCSLA